MRGKALRYAGTKCGEGELASLRFVSGAWDRLFLLNLRGC